MRKLVMGIVAAVVVIITGCSTVAGTVRGLGEDVSAGTTTIANWIKPAPKTE